MLRKADQNQQGNIDDQQERNDSDEYLYQIMLF